ncbi:MAG: hypothetical protein AB7I35_01270 [Ramlibacter sp.]
MGNAPNDRLMAQMKAGAQDLRREPTSHNGVLGWVTVEARAEAVRTLPSPSMDLVERTRIVEVTDSQLGRVQIRFKLARYKHYRNHFYTWRAEWADLAPAATQPGDA